MRFLSDLRRNLYLSLIFAYISAIIPISTILGNFYYDLCNSGFCDKEIIRLYTDYALYLISAICILLSIYFIFRLIITNRNLKKKEKIKKILKTLFHFVLLILAALLISLVISNKSCGGQGLCGIVEALVWGSFIFYLGGLFVIYAIALILIRPKRK